MKKAMKTRIASVVLALVMIAALSATAFADGPQGGPQQGGFQQGRQMGGPQQGGFDQDRQIGGPQQGGFGQDRQMGNPQQGGFGQDRQIGGPQQGGFGQDRQLPEIPEDAEGRTSTSDGGNRQSGPMNGQLPLEDPDEAEDMTPPEKPEGENPSLPQDEQGMFRLFQQFLEWLKENNAA